jgi:hypothetical protein
MPPEFCLVKSGGDTLKYYYNRKKYFYGGKMAVNRESNSEIQKELQPVIDSLKQQGITQNSKYEEVVGLGDIVESTLKSFGITEERFKQFFGLQECNCKERKKWLNNLFTRYVSKKALQKPTEEGQINE